ncbi:MAG: hypothetical protein Q7S44_02760 [bacterium]|nr:hypothetical protein [bacterium]
MAAEYDHEIRGGHLFGYGTYYLLTKEAISTPEAIYNTALLLGWSHGCPIARELCDPANRDYGPQRMVKRYREVNAWFCRLSQIAQRENLYLHYLLTHPVTRRVGEPIGKCEKESVPPSHQRQIAPMTTIWGYATPRVVIEVERLKSVREWERTQRVYELALEQVKEAHSPLELLVSTSKAALLQGVRAVDILKHTLAVEVLTTENCSQTYIHLAQFLERTVPNLMSDYLGLGFEERKSLGIAEIPSR